MRVAARSRTELLADYDFVKSGQAQMVDARSFQEYGKARIGMPKRYVSLLVKTAIHGYQI